MSFFKVVKNSWRRDELYSTSKSPLVVEYKVNEWVYPKDGGGKLFVFDNFEDAYDFYILFGSAIYQCDIIGEPETVDEIARYFADIENFWKTLSGISTITPPRGTKLVEAVKLIRQVKNMTDKNIEEVVDNLTTNAETFSAWNVTQKLRGKGYWAEHDRVRQYVHDYMKNSTDYTDYNNGKYIEYVPLAQPAVKTAFFKKPVVKNCTVQNTSNSGIKTPISSFHTGVKSKNRVTIPSSIVKNLGLSPRDYVWFDGTKIYTDKALGLKKSNFNGKGYTVDKYNEIRVPVKQTGAVTVNVYTDHLEIV